MGEPDIEGSALELRESNGHVPGTVVGGLLATTDPDELLSKGHERAKALMKMVNSQPKGRELVTKIRKGGKESRHLHLPAWQFVGSSVGVVIGDMTSEPFDDGWQARAVATAVGSGQTVGVADAECLRSERNWRDADDYAVRSMAQTRAQSKALRSVPQIGMVVVLAGYSPTPAEEMDSAAEGPQQQTRQAQTKTPRAKGTRQRSPGEPITPDQRRLYFAKVREAGLWGKRNAQEALLLWVTGDSKVDRCPKADFDRLLDALGQWQAVADEARAIASGELQAASDDQLRRAAQVAKRFDEAGV